MLMRKKGCALGWRTRTIIELGIGDELSGPSKTAVIYLTTLRKSERSSPSYVLHPRICLEVTVLLTSLGSLEVQFEYAEQASLGKVSVSSIHS